MLVKMLCFDLHISFNRSWTSKGIPPLCLRATPTSLTPKNLGEEVRKKCKVLDFDRQWQSDPGMFSAVVVVQGKLQYICLGKKHVSTSGKRKGSYFHVYLEIRVILQIVVCGLVRVM